MMGKNVMIPLALMESIMELLGYWDASKCDIAVQAQRYEALICLNLKKRKLGLRDGYAKMIRAEGGDARHDARIRYLQEKSQLREEETACPF